MSGAYKISPMPHILDIRCPKCGGDARFEFGEVVKIKLRGDVPFFRDSHLFEYRQVVDSCGHRWHAAIYYAALHGGSTEAISGLPEGYQPSDWDHSKYLRWGYTVIGAYACRSCHDVRRHDLSWPTDAFFQIDYRGETLWAFHRESAIALQKYIAASHRDADTSPWSRMLMHVPTHFLAASARDAVATRLERLLGSGRSSRKSTIARR